MKCPSCGKEEFETKNIRFTPEIKGEEVEVVAPASVCARCHAPLMDAAQMNELRRRAADRYRVLHGLLTSEEILKFRHALGMSQVAFANYLKVGEASIKRWETYYVQDPVQDEHLRLKCDEVYAEFNALELHWKSHPPDMYSGNRRFSWELFKQAVRFLIKVTKSPLFLNKALFYADFRHFKTYGKSITGMRYIHLEYGPCPDQYQNLIQCLMRDGSLAAAGHHQIKSTQEADLSVFDDEEIQTLMLVAQLAKQDQGKRLLQLSHEEKAYKETEPLQLISYEFARTLKI
ncbi:MAG: DUF4065 domain-containing protein [Parachlamydia sp.]|nr:DUF4065 domain-containing protein [Parachlamydia sp.]